MHKRQHKTKVTKRLCRLRTCRLLPSARMLLQHHLQLEFVAGRCAAASGSTLGCLCALCRDVYVPTGPPSLRAIKDMLLSVA